MRLVVQSYWLSACQKWWTTLRKLYKENEKYNTETQDISPEHLIDHNDEGSHRTPTTEK